MCTSRTAVTATVLVPSVVAAAPLEAAGGILLFVGLLALGRFALATAALDTGSPFGGMGASREMTVGALAEPALMLALFTAGLSAGSLNLGELVRRTAERGTSIHPSDLLAAAALFIVLLAEAGRVPIDNPATHLELTMIHEAMVLEYSGADLALVEWGSAVKELVFLTPARRALPPDRRRDEPRSRGDRRRPARARRERSSSSRSSSSSWSRPTPSCASSVFPS